MGTRAADPAAFATTSRAAGTIAAARTKTSVAGASGWGSGMGGNTIELIVLVLPIVGDRLGARPVVAVQRDGRERLLAGTMAGTILAARMALVAEIVVLVVLIAGTERSIPAGAARGRRAAAWRRRTATRNGRTATRGGRTSLGIGACGILEVVEEVPAHATEVTTTKITRTLLAAAAAALVPGLAIEWTLGVRDAVGGRRRGNAKIEGR
jgi:hypothetical protein